MGIACPMCSVLLASVVGHALAQTALTVIDWPPTVEPSETESEIDQCRAELAAAAEAATEAEVAESLRMYRGLGDEEWDEEDEFNFAIGYRKTSDAIDLSGECLDFRELELVPVDGVAQVTNAVVLLGPEPLSVRSLPITTNPVGFSAEYGYLGPFAISPPDPHVLNLFANLNTKGQGPAVLIGGNTGMHVRMSNSSYPPATDSAIVITPEQLQAVNAFATASLSRLTMGVPMIARDSSQGIEFVQMGLLQNINPSNIEALEVGNEPDHWQIEKKCFRSGNYTFTDFLQEYQAYESLLAPMLEGTNVALQGPAIAGCNTFPKGTLPCWQMDMPEFAAQTTNLTKLISWHRYGNSGCSVQTNLRTLLKDPIPGDETKSFDWLDAVSANLTSYGKRHYLAESGAFSCGGHKCISGTFASALWALDNMLEVAYRNSTRSAFHMVVDHIYSPFHLYNASSEVEVVDDGTTVDEAVSEEFEEEALSEERRRRRRRSGALGRTSPVEAKEAIAEVRRLPQRLRLLGRRQVVETSLVLEVEVAAATGTSDTTEISAATASADGALETIAAEGAATTAAGDEAAAATEVDVAAPATEEAVAGTVATGEVIETAVGETAGAVPEVVTASTAPAEEVVGTIPAEQTAAIVATDEIAATTPAEQTAAAVPTDVIASTIPAEDTAAVVATDEIAATIPAEEAVALASTDEVASTIPAEGTAAVVPTDEVASTIPAEGTAAVVPTDEVASTIPAEETTSVIPKDDTAATVPAAETAATAPAAEISETFPAVETTSTVPVDEVAGTTPASEIAETAAATAGVSSASDLPTGTTEDISSTTSDSGVVLTPVPSVPEPATVSDKTIKANPLFYAMWQMVELVDNIPDAFIYKPQVTFEGAENVTSIKVWGISGSSNLTKIVIIHKDPDQLDPMPVKIGGHVAATAAVTRLVSDGLLTSTAYKAGQTIGTDGKVLGTRYNETVVAVAGVLELWVDPLTVVVIEIEDKADGL